MKMLKCVLMVAIIIAFFGNLNLKAQQSPSDCSNFPCNPNLPWSYVTNLTVASLDCPDCVFKYSFFWRIIVCGGKTLVQTEICEWGWATPLTCLNCNWTTGPDQSDDAITTFLHWCKNSPLFWNAEVFEYYSVPCWSFGNTGPNGSPTWHRCPATDCCIWRFDYTTDPLTQERHLTNPVFIEPAFNTCNSELLPPFPLPNFCYSVCGLITPGYLKLGASTDEVINTSRPVTYPNPGKEIIEIQFSVQKEGFLVFEVYDLLGNLILKSKEFNSKQGQYELDISKIPIGIYYYNIKMNNIYISLGNEINVQR